MPVRAAFRACTQKSRTTTGRVNPSSDVILPGHCPAIWYLSAPLYAAGSILGVLVHIQLSALCANSCCSCRSLYLRFIPFRNAMLSSDTWPHFGHLMEMTPEQSVSLSYSLLPQPGHRLTMPTRTADGGDCDTIPFLLTVTIRSLRLHTDFQPRLRENVFCQQVQLPHTDRQRLSGNPHMRRHAAEAVIFPQVPR